MLVKTEAQLIKEATQQYNRRHARTSHPHPDYCSQVVNRDGRNYVLLTSYNKVFAIYAVLPDESVSHIVSLSRGTLIISYTGPDPDHRQLLDETYKGVKEHAKDYYATLGKVSA